MTGQEYNNEGSDFEDSNDLSKFLQVEATEGEIISPGYESDEEFSPDKPLICKICFATFKTKSGWRNHKITHQKFRTKEFACYICYRRFYWDKDCRRHIKNIHGEENYDREESRRAADVNYPKIRNLNLHQQHQHASHQQHKQQPRQHQQHYHQQQQQQQQQHQHQSQQQHQHYRQQSQSQYHQQQQFQQYHPNTSPTTSKFVHPNNNIFKMKIELLKSQEKKAINTNAIKEPNSDDNSTPQDDFTPPDTNENTNDCFYNDDNDSHSNDDNNDGLSRYDDNDANSNDSHSVAQNSSHTSTPRSGFVKEGTITMDEIKDHMQKVKDDLGELLEEGDSSDENGTGHGHDDSFETVDPNLYTEDISSKLEDSPSRNKPDENNDNYLEEKNMTESNFSDNDFASANVDGMGGVAISDQDSVVDDNTDFKVNENMTVDMFDFTVPADIVIQPKSSSDLFLLKKRFKCQDCPRTFLNVKYLNIHEKSCSAPPDSPYKCTICSRCFQDFDGLQIHWKINHNRQKMI